MARNKSYKYNARYHERKRQSTNSTKTTTTRKEINKCKQRIRITQYNNTKMLVEGLQTRLLTRNYKARTYANTKITTSKSTTNTKRIINNNNNNK
jgi:hypothetical protein